MCDSREIKEQRQNSAFFFSLDWIFDVTRSGPRLILTFAHARVLGGAASERAQTGAPPPASEPAQVSQYLLMNSALMWTSCAPDASACRSISVLRAACLVHGRISESREACLPFDRAAKRPLHCSEAPSSRLLGLQVGSSLNSRCGSAQDFGDCFDRLVRNIEKARSLPVPIATTRATRPSPVLNLKRPAVEFHDLQHQPRR